MPAANCAWRIVILSILLVSLPLSAADLSASNFDPVESPSLETISLDPGSLHPLLGVSLLPSSLPRLGVTPVHHDSLPTNQDAPAGPDFDVQDSVPKPCWCGLGGVGGNCHHRRC